MASPDIQAGTPILKYIAYGFGSVVLLIGGALGIGYLVVDDGVNLDEDEDTIFQRGLPDDFFWSDNGEELPNADELPSLLVVEDNEEEIEKAAIAARKKALAKRKAAKRKAAKPAPKPAPKVESIDEMFGAVAVSAYDEEASLRDVMNTARRGSGSTFTQQTDSARFEKIEESKDPNWKQYGVLEDTASFPVDMRRVITADRNIRCILIEEITSELEGKITCIVEENVYGAQGRLVLIPAGSKAIGYYAPLKKAGDTRLFAGWERIITPQGINVQLSGNDSGDGARLADAMGRAGITGDVDNKYMEKYGLAFMVATLNAVASAQYVAGNANQQIVIENYGREISQLSNTILNSNINIKPVVTIPAGSRILISPLVDIWFQKPKGSEIIAKFVN